MNNEYYIPLHVRYLLAAWTSIFMMFGVAVMLYKPSMSSYECGSLIIALGLTGTSIGMTVGCRCNKIHKTK